MHYFTLDTVANIDEDACFTDKHPDGVDMNFYRLQVGEPFAAFYPSQPDAMRLALGDDYLGLKLPSFLGNTTSTLIVDNNAADIIVAHQVDPLERFPFALLDHKGRVYSRDYVYLNPLNRVDCMNVDRSEVSRTRKGSIMNIPKLVLDKRKLADLPDLLRLADDPTVYLFSETLVNALQQHGCSNFLFNAVAMG